MKMATNAQVDYCKTLFRKSKLYYRTLKDDAALRDAVMERTGYDLDELEAYEAEEIIGMLAPEAARQREGWREEEKPCNRGKKPSTGT